MKVMVVDERKELLREPYVVLLGGWTLERYLAEAPEHLIWELVRSSCCCRRKCLRQRGCHSRYAPPWWWKS